MSMKNEDRKNVKLAPKVHRRLKTFARQTGMKIEALADKAIEAGLEQLKEAA